MISIGVDVSKGKSTICVLKPYGEVVSSPFEIVHTEKELLDLANMILRFDDEIKVSTSKIKSITFSSKFFGCSFKKFSLFFIYQFKGAIILNAKAPENIYIILERIFDYNYAIFCTQNTN